MATSFHRLGAGLPARRRGARPLTAILVGAVFALAGCGSGAPHAEPSYGDLPAFLPTATVRADSALDATVDRPAVTSQGDSVTAHLAAGSVTVTVAGPEVPGEGLPYDAPTSTCTWRITLTGATADLPVRAGDFTALDHLRATYHPAPVGAAPPAVLRPGATVTFELRATMLTGEGLMRWAPDGTHIVASWDFVVETD